MDKDLATGMAKLARTHWPVKLHRMPSSLAKFRTQLDAVKQARDAKNEGVVVRIKKQLGLGLQTPNLDKQAELLEKKLELLEQDLIEGELTPLTESERWSVQAHFVHMESFLKGELMREGDTDEIKRSNASAQRSVEFCCTQIWMSKWLGYSLKRREGKNLKPYWAGNVVPVDLEPNVIMQLYNTYHTVFTPTESELGKSVAPTT